MSPRFRFLACAVVSVVTVGFVSTTPLTPRPPCCSRGGSDVSRRPLLFRSEVRRRRRDGAVS
jgi:hypothetical protein